MSNVKRGNLTACPERWKHLDFWKRVFWKQERQAQEREIAAEAGRAWQSRAKTDATRDSDEGR